MDYRYLKAFILTAKYLSFTKAANELHIAQSAISRQIKLLEESIGSELIIRSSKKVILTDLGRELYLSSLNFDTIISGLFKDSGSRILKVGILHGLLKNWFPPILETYRKEYSRSINIQIGEGDSLVQKLEIGEFDIIFSNTHYQTQTISSKKIFKEEFSIISLDEIDKTNLSIYPWIIYSEEDGLFREQKKKSSSITIVDSISTIIDLVTRGLGIAIVPNHCLARKDDLQIIPVKSKMKNYIYQTTLSYNKMPQYIRELSDCI